jgi:sphingolipid delta-4 desaturase
MGHQESHQIRRREILKAHPEVKLLFGKDKTTIWVVVACNLILFNSAYIFRDASWLWFVLSAYVIGGTFSHTCFLVIHDLTHFTCF